ncbi:DUF1150 family protein [Solirhodobacter olei]|uniref:DUF1150 family protein n=1 Tax=Solirhodobacter olei TaxID=2493082 RepID=UPI000FDC8E54|nr:DUF1150 family protein [Solirhodobacter olei]
MDTRYEFGPEIEGEAPIVYVRPIPVAELPEEVRAEVRAQIGDQPMLYAVHGADGERLALVRDRKMAFLLARQNDMAPVNVH